MYRFHMSKIHFLSTLLILSLTGCACSDNRRPTVQQKEETEKETVAVAEAPVEAKEVILEAFAMINPYKDDNISGIVTFAKVPGGIKIIADVKGLTPGKHGFHVHEHGDCSGHDGMAAGGHFNPTNSKHGGPDSAERHVGDFGNLDADENGYAHYERIDNLIAFEGKNSIIGKSLIIHAEPDDLVTQPTGASGARIACGLIEAR